MIWRSGNRRTHQFYVGNPRGEGLAVPWPTLVVFASLMALLLFSPAGCAPQRQVTLVVDHNRRGVRTTGQTVRDVLTEQHVELGKLDRVEPDLWEELRGNVTIVVTRVEEPSKVEQIEIPFERRTVRNRGLPSGESRLIQPGQNGMEEVVYRVTLEDGVEVRRKEVQRRVIHQAMDEIMMVSSAGQAASVPITGTVAYISSGNAWVMRHNSGAARSLTTSGDLDQRVLSLSSNGERLLFSRGVAEGPPTPLNTIWVISTTVVGESPISTTVEGAIYAEWLPDGDSFVYSTAERITGAPGWKARNDLRVFSLSAKRDVRKFSGHADDLYSWWGANYALASDGERVAYGSAQQVGVIDLKTGVRTPLIDFPVFHTYSEWVWVPTVSWSPDGNFLVATVHGTLPDAVPEDSPVFDLWAVRTDAEPPVKVRLKSDVGMWAMPRWAPLANLFSPIAYGQAREPGSSQNSLYDLCVVDSDGGNARTAFKAGANGLRVPQVTWATDANQLLFVRDGDVYLFDVASGSAHQLTDDGYSGSPRWSR
jgi:resuscitation-promoting factor RpfB